MGNTSKKWNKQTVVSVVSALIALIALFYTYKSNDRAEKLFGSQIRPLIQDRPIKINIQEKAQFVETTLQVINYSGFDAFDISFDLKYANNDWVRQWIMSRKDHLSNKKEKTMEEVEELKGYSMEPLIVPYLPAGKEATRTATGALTLKEILAAQPSGLDVLVRTT